MRPNKCRRCKGYVKSALFCSTFAGMEITSGIVKMHVVAELLILKLSRERQCAVADDLFSFWIFYWHELKANDFVVEEIINQDSDMSKFFDEWEDYDTHLDPSEVRFPIISLAMKLVLAKGLKYADDHTLGTMLETLTDKFRKASYG